MLHFFLGLILVLISLLPPPSSSKGPRNGGSSQPLLLLPPQGKVYSYSSPVPVWGTIHGKQSSMNLSNMGPSVLKLFKCASLSQGAALQEQTIQYRSLLGS